MIKFPCSASVWDERGHDRGLMMSIYVYIYLYMRISVYIYIYMNIQIMRTTVLLVQQISSLQGCIPSSFHRREKDAWLARADGQRFRL
jgi:hypothetical protein